MHLVQRLGRLVQLVKTVPIEAREDLRQVGEEARSREDVRARHMQPRDRRAADPLGRACAQADHRDAHALNLRAMVAPYADGGEASTPRLGEAITR